MTTAGSVTLSLLLLVNVLVQVLFCGVINFYFLADPYPSISFFRRWRESVAHDYAHMDQVLGVSMVSSVCNGDFSIATSSSQQLILEQITQYTSLSNELGISIGASLCTICLVVWCFTVSKEVKGTIKFLKAIFNLPRGEGMTRLAVAVGGDGVYIETISTARLMFCTAVSMVRATIALILVVTGSLWLSNTKSIQDLVLNVAALGFILDVDETLFAALVPASVQSLVRALEPMQVHTKKYVDWFSPMAHAFGVAVFVILIVTTQVVPAENKMHAIENEMCGGIGTAQDFVMAKNAVGTIISMNTTAFRPELMSDKTLMRKAVSERIWMAKQDLSSSVDYQEGFRSQLSKTVVELASVQPCEDLQAESQTHLWAAIQDQSGTLGGSSCEDFVPFCGTQSSVALRLHCPVTCSCGAQKHRYRFGCPESSCVAE
eukprot:gnl/TRDRNA2_/TRDRNA2_172305_c1_seq1.p1 gnl/TRDRNA2_/TRDRNA2_172305_c1~~gnl/TRDRNA2_/TRDRNA2_172305_c1_seq1.p1  ORF type:complete len:489 (+),score=49.86 gnl/TRDRNA2_/TRDRNA2_172305_c1_seq1:174-1469(+)